jgi:uncharacterized phage protein (TIGR02216 family)
MVMTVGLGLLRLSPGDFWSMTTREFERAAAAVLPDQAPALGRGELDALMAAFPDDTGRARRDG